MKRCSKCREFKQLTEFNRHRGTKDGMQCQCRDCARVARVARYERVAASPKALPHDDGKRCGRCDTFKPWAEFYKSRGTKDGHQPWCRDCQRDASRTSAALHADARKLRQAEKLANAATVGDKQCTKCGETYPLVNFYRHPLTKDGRATYCAPCQRASTRAWREANAEKVREMNAKYQSEERNKRAARRRSKRWWLKAYGLTPEDYDAILEAQNGVCAICLQPERYIDARTGEPRRLSVDHDHVTGKNRGLLCGPCNRAIGQFEDDHERLQRAAEYLLRAAG